MSKDNKPKRGRRRSLAEQVQDLRRKADVLERKSQQEQERRQTSAKGIIAHRLATGHSWKQFADYIAEQGGKVAEWQYWQAEVKRGGPEAVAYFVEKAIENPALLESWREARKRKPRKRPEREIAADIERLTEMANEWVREAKRPLKTEKEEKPPGD